MVVVTTRSAAAAPLDRKAAPLRDVGEAVGLFLVDDDCAGTTVRWRVGEAGGRRPPVSLLLW